MFEAIRTDPAVFAAVRVASDAGMIVWPNGADLVPDTLHRGRPSARMERQAQADSARFPAGRLGVPARQAQRIIRLPLPEIDAPRDRDDPAALAANPPSQRAARTS